MNLSIWGQKQTGKQQLNWVQSSFFFSEAQLKITRAIEKVAFVLGGWHLGCVIWGFFKLFFFYRSCICEQSTWLFYLDKS